MLRKCICMIVTVALVVCVSVAPVGAVDAEGAFKVTIGYSESPYNTSVLIPRIGNKDVVSLVGVPISPSGSFLYVWDVEYLLGDEPVYPGGSVAVYFSYAFGTLSSGSFIVDPRTQYNYTYSTANTSSFVGTAELTEFNFSTGVSGEFLSSGIQLSARIDDIDSLTAFNFLVGSNDSGIVYRYSSGDSRLIDFNFYIPSASLVYTQSSADLDALESVADQIAEGNAIARAMYGDIMNALNALKDDTSLMSSYINDCLIYLNSIDNKTMNIYNLCASYLHNLADIAQTADDIEAELESFHTDFMSKLDLLISTITTESHDIQATMNSIYQQLIAWLESNFTEAINPELDSTNDDLNQGIANSEAIEQEWTGSLSDNWSAMHIDDFSFDSSFTSGFMWVSAWVTNIYNALGLYGSIIILPLIIGICKLLLGYFRFSGHGHSSGGDDVDA